MTMTYRYVFEKAEERLKRAVWQKGAVVQGHHPNIYRKDICGHWMRYSDNGSQTDFGWEIDHIIPSSKGGPNDLSNLQPLYWENNRKKGDKYPWFCAAA